MSNEPEDRKLRDLADRVAEGEEVDWEREGIRR